MSNQFSILNKGVQAAERRLRANVLSPKTSAMIDGENSLSIENNNGVYNENGKTEEVIGKDYMNAKYPNEIEYYACAFELVDSNDETVEFFSLPIMPSGMNESLQNMASVKKTMSGIIVNQNQSFIPFNISINGDFGRRFRNIKSESKISSINGTDKSNDELSTVNGKKKKSDVGDIFDTDNKTGYGSTKILERILRRSMASDDNQKPYNLYFYNLAFNSLYNVELQTFTFSQSKDKNMIWGYNITLKVLAPADSTLKKGSKEATTKVLDDSKFTNEARQQSSSLKNVVIPEGGSGLSPIEKILYDGTKAVGKFGGKVTSNISGYLSKNDPKLLNAIEEVSKLAKNQNRIFLATVGVNASQSYQRFSALRQKLNF